MLDIVSRLDKKFRPIFESAEYAWWKDPDSPDYNRQMAEDALYHTIGPLTDNPRWDVKWTSPSKPVPGFAPNGPAPRWDEYEVTVAMAGDPSLLYNEEGGPTSPSFGNKGGAPIFRLAKAMARRFNKSFDRSVIDDFYGNGIMALTRLMKPGYDEARGSFVKYAYRYIQSAMEIGGGATLASKSAAGVRNKKGIIGLRGLLDYKITQNNPETIRQIASQIKGKYRDLSSNDKSDDNPLGPYSNIFWELANAYADALESGDDDRIYEVQNSIEDKIAEIDLANKAVLGAQTGVSQAITDKTRKTPIKIASMDAPTGDDESSTMAGSIAGKTEEESWIKPGVVRVMLKMALDEKYMADLARMMRVNQDLAGYARELGMDEVVSGPLKVNEFRFLIRTLGPRAENYPGKGVVRSRLNIPRNGKGWWSPGEDPEIEPFTNKFGVEKMFKSRWVSGRGYKGPSQHQPFRTMQQIEICNEMSAENYEFNILAKGNRFVSGIGTVSNVKTDKLRMEYIRYFEEMFETNDPQEAAEIRDRFMQNVEFRNAPSDRNYYHYFSTEMAAYVRALKEKNRATIDKFKRHLKEKSESNEGKAVVAEGFSKVSVSKALGSALQKLQLIGFVEREFLEVGEQDIDENRSRRLALTEQRNKQIDREIIAETCEWACKKIQAAINEKSPPGWKKTVEHMKEKGMTDEEAFSRAWATHKKGGSRPDTRKKNKYYAESSMKPVDSISDDPYEIE